MNLGKPVQVYALTVWKITYGSKKKINKRIKELGVLSKTPSLEFSSCRVFEFPSFEV